MKSFGTIGDIGDSVVFLPSIKSAGGGILYCVDRHGCRPFSDRIPLIKRLFESQPYIESVLPWSGEVIDFDSSSFRSAGMTFGVNLATLHADYIGLSPDLNEPWLDVPADIRSKGKIVVARSPRYRNKHFPWQSIVEQYRSYIVFIGLRSEWQDFCKLFGEVHYCPTNDLYEVACLIKGSELFIGNQSSPNAVCEGLKHPSILEVCLTAPDCIYPRSNAVYCVDGSMKIEILGREFETSVSRIGFNLFCAPPGGWEVVLNGEKLKAYSYALLIQIISDKFRVSQNEATNMFFKNVKIPKGKDVQRVLELLPQNINDLSSD